MKGWGLIELGVHLDPNRRAVEFLGGKLGGWVGCEACCRNK